MGYKFNQNTGFWEAYHSKRHPITRTPHCARRTKCKTEAEARRVEKELIIQVEAKLHEKIVPKWRALVEMYDEDCRHRGLSEKTINSARVCIEAHTFRSWADRPVDSIARDEIISVHKGLQLEINHKLISEKFDWIVFAIPDAQLKSSLSKDMSKVSSA